MEGLNIEPFRLVDQMKRQSELFVPLFTCKETVSLTAGTDNEIVLSINYVNVLNCNRCDPGPSQVCDVF